LRDQAWGTVLACQTENRAAQAQFRSGIKTAHSAWCQYLWGEVYVVVAVVGRQDCEIDRGGQFWPAKPKTQPHGLSFGLVRERQTVCGC
jgi:hypothetical protein